MLIHVSRVYILSLSLSRAHKVLCSDVVVLSRIFDPMNAIKYSFCFPLSLKIYIEHIRMSL